MEEPSYYRHAIPSSRLGTSHPSLGSFHRQLRVQKYNRDQVQTEFSLVVILSRNAHLHDDDDGGGVDSRTNETLNGTVNGTANGASNGTSNETSNTPPTSSKKISILLGKKLRGFGKGFYNCFGGKLEKSKGEHDHPAKGAVREVAEETGINIDLDAMEDGFVGVIEFTFDDYEENCAMRVHLYCVFVSLDKEEDDHGSNIAAPLQKNGSGSMSPSQKPRDKTAVTKVHPDQIRGCDEIEPKWFHDIHDIPLDEMFADDSLWLTKLLTHYNNNTATSGAPGDGKVPPPSKFTFNAWFHFHPGGTTTNSIMHYFIQNTTSNSNTSNNTSSTTASKPTLERKLFHALHVNHMNRIQSPSIKEFKENWAMANAVRTFLKDGNVNKGNNNSRMEYVLDVAGGHGALGALFLLLVPKCRYAVVIDPAECGSGKKGVREAWSKFWEHNDDNDDAAKAANNNGNTVPSNTMVKKELRYRHECLRTGMRKELDAILSRKGAKSTNVTVVACHACQHLTDETLQIASEYGVNVAVLPCCQKDHDGWWKRLAKSMGISIGTLMDIIAAGKMLGWETGHTAGVRYQVKMKLMKESISLQNRMILCKAITRDENGVVGGGGGGETTLRRDRKKEMAHEKLTQAYHRAHKVPNEKTSSSNETLAKSKSTLAAAGASSDLESNGWSVLPSLLTGFCLGAAFSFVLVSKLQKKN